MYFGFQSFTLKMLSYVFPDRFLRLNVHYLQIRQQGMLNGSKHIKKLYFFTFSQCMDGKLHCREVSLAHLSTELIKSNPSTEHQVPDYLLIVGHVIDDPFDGSLLRSFCLCELWDDTGGSRNPGRCRLFHLCWILVGISAHFRLWP